ncbi:FxSxx-COOH cyclophane-containing RiPP peptide [Actinophytocola xinjiangensis]|uniref:FxSxx-COOH cyclophane-containing RiPP peptide n=1 Tax=Actinophytocola xinjiangensis TaxID=485602 RepID=UPI0009472ABA|nr:FxSxx-COOH cyclophane-containing RiPP peptide [Actinophytocola xinjiangensis]
MDHSREIESDLVDVLDLSLDQLATLPDNVLRAALRRALLAPDSDSQLFAMFQDAV